MKIGDMKTIDTSHWRTPMRYDAKHEVYRDCKWCKGKGCLQCKNEADKAYKEAFPDGPKPIATFDTTTPEGVVAAKGFLHDLLKPQGNAAEPTCTEEKNNEEEDG